MISTTADPKRGFYGGGGIDARIGSAARGLGDVDRRRFAALGRGLKARLDGISRAQWCRPGHSTSLALETNSVSIDPDAQGRVGHSRNARHLQGPSGRSGVRNFLQDRSVEIMEAAGAAEDLARRSHKKRCGGDHLLGTCRMGNDPASSVIDKYHRTHDVPNLFLCDGSSFVTSGRGQPTMTIQALAFRAADHIGEFAKRNEI